MICVTCIRWTNSIKFKPSPCPGKFNYESTTNDDRWYGDITFPVNATFEGSTIRVELDRPSQLLVTTAGPITSKDNQVYFITHDNIVIEKGSTYKLIFMVKFDKENEVPMLETIHFNGQRICPPDLVTLALGGGNDFSSLRPDIKATAPTDVLSDIDKKPRNPTRTTTQATYNNNHNNGGSFEYYNENSNTNRATTSRIPNSNNFGGGNNGNQGNNGYNPGSSNTFGGGNGNQGNTGYNPGNTNFNNGNQANNGYNPGSSNTFGGGNNGNQGNSGYNPGNTDSGSGNNGNQGNNGYNSGNLNNFHGDRNTGNQGGSGSNNGYNPNTSNNFGSTSNGFNNNQGNNGFSSGNSNSFGNNGGGSGNNGFSSGNQDTFGSSSTGFGSNSNSNRPNNGFSSGNSNNFGTNSNINQGNNGFSNLDGNGNSNQGNSGFGNGGQANANPNQGGGDAIFNQGGGTNNGFTGRPNLGNEATVSSQIACGSVSIANPLITFAQNSEHGQWPWHVALFMKDEVNPSKSSYICGGSLVSKNRVITAAHCVSLAGNRIVNPNSLTAYMGKYNINTDESTSLKRAISNFKVNPEYNKANFHNDIAILNLNEDVEYSNYVRPVCLWEAADGIQDVVGQNGYVVGWGYNEDEQLNTELKQATMPIVSTEKCARSDPQFFSEYVSEKAFCAGSLNGTGPCKGDSGGGLVVKRNNSWYLRGIVSVSAAPKKGSVCNNHQYIVFTDTAKYTDFIKRNI